MYFKSFEKVLRNECASCRKSFRDGFGMEQEEVKSSAGTTSLTFTDLELQSFLVEDVTNFQAVSYIYGVPPSVLENSVKNHLMTLTKQQNDNGSPVSEEEEEGGEENDPLSSFSLTLCQNCSRMLAELYTVFYKFEKLSNKLSIITKVVQHAKDSLESQAFKLEKVCETLDESMDEFDSFDGFNYDSYQNAAEDFDSNSIKEEEFDLESEGSFHEINVNSDVDDEESNHHAEETQGLENHGQAEVEMNQSKHPYESGGGKSTRLTGKSGRDNETKRLNKRRTMTDCNNCHKTFKSHYLKRIHEIVSTLDVRTLEKATLKEQNDVICPKCEMDFSTVSQRFLRLKFHCLEKHNLIISVDETELENFTHQLRKEKKFCLKYKIAEGHNSDGSHSNLTEKAKQDSISKSEILSTKKSKKLYYPYGTCYRCGKVCMTYYWKKLHEICHKLDIPSLENEKLKTNEVICPRCGVDFKHNQPRLMRLRIHCLEEHNLIVSRSVPEFQMFTRLLLDEKEYCQKNKQSVNESNINSDNEESNHNATQTHPQTEVGGVNQNEHLDTSVAGKSTRIARKCTDENELMARIDGIDNIKAEYSPSDDCDRTSDDDRKYEKENADNVEMSENYPPYGTETSRSTRRPRKQKYENETYSLRLNEEHHDAVTTDKNSFSEDFNRSSGDKSTDRKADAHKIYTNAAAKMDSAIELRRSTRHSTKSISEKKPVDENDECDDTEISDEYSSPEDSVSSTEDESKNKKRNPARRKIETPIIKRRKRRDRNDSPPPTALDLEKQTVQRFKAKAPGFYSLRCILCKIYFPTLHLFKRHHQSHHKITWKDDITLEKWMDICAEKSYNCEICDEFFISKEELNFHLITHIREEEIFSEFNEVIQGPPFVCPKCENPNKWYENWAGLQLHGHKVHRVSFTNKLTEPPQRGRCSRSRISYYCTDCDVPFTVKGPWAVHLNQIHNLSGCVICGKTFSDEQLLKSHIENEHDSENPRSKEHVCKNCNEDFPNVLSLWMHTFVHIVEGEENIELQTFEEFSTLRSGSSEIQSKTCKDDSKLNTNSQSVSICNTLFSCLKCKKRFKSFYELKIHQLSPNVNDYEKLQKVIVTGREFHCPVCAANCRRGIILREHCLRRHQTIVSTTTYSAETFIRKLMKEKKYCNQIPQTRYHNRKSTAISCVKCHKNFKSYYLRRVHQYASTRDVLTLEKATLAEQNDATCPKCEMDFNTVAQRLLRLKCHCLEKHNLIVSVDETELENFTLQLIKENKFCKQNKIAVKSNTATSPSNISQDDLSSKSISKSDILATTRQSKKVNNNYGTCYRCGKLCLTYYWKKWHEMCHKLDIPSLENEILKTNEVTCPKCGMDFKSHNPRLLRLKIHCLEKHNLIVSRSVPEFQTFKQQLLDEKEYCQKNKQLDFEEPVNNSSTPITNRGDLQYVCSLCSKVCNSDTTRRIHEIAHKIDLTTVEVENTPGTSEFTCPRCEQLFSSNLEMRLHCLETHDVIASTETFPGEKFVQLLSDEQELIKIAQNGNANEILVLATAEDKDDEKLESQENATACNISNEANENQMDNCSTSTDAVVGNEDGRNVKENAAKLFVCEIEMCGKTFKSGNSLRSHRTAYHSALEFTCEKCGASVKGANRFRFHKRVHYEKEHGIRPTCDICGKSYISSKGLSKHKSKYHPKKKLSCPICKKTFADQDYARKHIRKHQELSKTGNKRWRLDSMK